MPVARLFLMWAYMEPDPGKWDFSLYDAAFRSAEKHHVRIVATLTPNDPPTHMGGDGNQGVGILPTTGAPHRSRSRHGQSSRALSLQRRLGHMAPGK